MNLFLSSNPTQMRILKRIFVLQAVAEHAVKAGVSEQQLRRSEMIIDVDSMFHQPRRGVIGFKHIMPSVSTSSTLRFQDLGTGMRKI